MVAGGSAAGRLSQKVAQGWRVKLFEKWQYIQLSEREKFGGSYAKEMFMQTPGVAIYLGCTAFTAAIMYYTYRAQNIDQRFTNKPFKNYYEVYRPDDPRIEEMRRMPLYYNQEGTIPNDYRTK